MRDFYRPIRPARSDNPYEAEVRTALPTPGRGGFLSARIHVAGGLLTARLGHAVEHG